MSKRTSVVPTTPETPRGLSLKQAAAYSGLALWSLRTLVWDGRLPAVKVGRRLLILRDTFGRLPEEPGSSPMSSVILYQGRTFLFGKEPSGVIQDADGWPYSLLDRDRALAIHAWSPSEIISIMEECVSLGVPSDYQPIDGNDELGERLLLIHSRLLQGLPDTFVYAPPDRNSFLYTTIDKLPEDTVDPELLRLCREFLTATEAEDQARAAHKLAKKNGTEAEIAAAEETLVKATRVTWEAHHARNEMLDVLFPVSDADDEDEEEEDEE